MLKRMTVVRRWPAACVAEAASMPEEMPVTPGRRRGEQLHAMLWCDLQTCLWYSTNRYKYHIWEEASHLGEPRLIQQITRGDTAVSCGNVAITQTVNLKLSESVLSMFELFSFFKVTDSRCYGGESALVEEN